MSGLLWASLSLLLPCRSFCGRWVMKANVSLLFTQDWQSWIPSPSSLSHSKRTFWAPNELFFHKKKAQFFQSCQYFCQRGNSQSEPHTKNGLCSVVVIQGAVIVALMCSYVLLSFSCIAGFLQEITFKPKSWGMHHMGFTSINSPRPSELRITWEPKSSSSKPSSKAVICPRQS